MRKAQVDLHVHTYYSDGVHPPATVVELAKEAGLVAMAVADHDHVGGLEEAFAAGARLGVEVLPGVELSSQWEELGDIHLLGYGFDHRHPELLGRLEEFQQFRQGRNARVLEKVNERLRLRSLAPIPLETVQSLADGALGRPHIAQALVQAGYVADQDAAFDQYLVPCNVPKQYFPMDEAIALLHRCGGVAVLAHPLYITQDRKRFEKLLDELTLLGLDGIEVYCSGTPRQDQEYYLTQARRRDLLVTGGSDYHGHGDSPLAIGTGFGNLAVGYEAVLEIRSALNRLSRAGLESA